MQKDVDTKKEAMSINDFLEIFSVSRSTFYTEKNRGALKVLKRGKTVIITREAAQSWLKQIEAEQE